MAIHGFDEVLTAAKLGAHWALEVLYREMSPSVIGWLRSQGHSDADDIASEVFVNMVRDIRQFDGDESRLRTWIFALAHHRLIDVRRYQTRRPITYSDPNDLPDALMNTDHIESSVLERLEPGNVYALLDQLSEDQRIVITLRIVAGLNLDQTASAINKSVNAVKALQHRGLATLARHYKENLSAPITFE